MSVRGEAMELARAGGAHALSLGRVCIHSQIAERLLETSSDLRNEGVLGLLSQIER